MFAHASRSSSVGRLVRALIVLVALALPTPLFAQATVQVIASGLDNPRGLAFGPDGFLYVAEAGKGGPGPCGPDPASQVPGATRCFGTTAAITRVSGIGVQQRVVTGMPSIAPLSGNEAVGPHDIDFGFGNAYVSLGWGGNPNLRAPFEALGVKFGNLVQILPTGAWSYIADLTTLETTTNPDGAAVDSNPYSFRILNNRAVFTDAGANTLSSIALTGAMTGVATFPARVVPSPFGGTVPMQAVPTAVTSTPDGTLYVGELTGFPFPRGGARVYRIAPNSTTAEVVATGFTNIIDIAISPAGIGYVLEHDADGILPPVGPSTAGRLIRVEPSGAQTVIPVTGLQQPGGIVVGPDGALYVTNKSSLAGSGEVLRIVP